MKKTAKRGIAFLFVLFLALSLLPAAAGTAAAAGSTARWIPPTVKIELSGKELVEGEFTVTLRRTSGTTDPAATNADGHIPVLPDRGDASAHTATNDGEGYVTFSPVDFTEEDEGTWVFTIRAIADPTYRENYEWDVQEVSFEVTVYNSPAIGVYVVDNDVPDTVTLSATYTEPEDENKNIFEIIVDGIIYIGDFFSFLWEKLGDGIEWIATIPERFDEWVGGLERDHTTNFLTQDLNVWFKAMLSSIGNRIYTILYPIGVAVLIVSWAAGIMTSGITLSMEPGNKYSLVRAALQLLVGIVLLSLMPYLLMLIFSLCNQLRAQIATTITVKEGHFFIVTICQFLIYLQVLRATLLYCISPIFAGVAAGGETLRRMATNFIKEYCLICLQIPFMTIYILLVDQMMNHYAIDVGIIASLIIAVSVFTVNKHLEKLFH